MTFPPDQYRYGSYRDWELVRRDERRCRRFRSWLWLMFHRAREFAKADKRSSENRGRRNMTTWLKDDRGNKCSVEYFGTQEAAQAALDSLEDCDNCINCSRCSRCSRCSDCSDCSGCSRCSGCSGCSDCLGCSGCSDCSDCSGCLGCSHVAFLYSRENLQGDPDTITAGQSGPPPVPVIKNIHQTVFAAASNPKALNMGRWHSCENTHCWAGWVVTLAGEEGKKLEAFFDTPLAAMKILDASSPLRVSPVRFFETNDDALRHMKDFAEREAAAVPQS